MLLLTVFGIAPRSIYRLFHMLNSITHTEAFIYLFILNLFIVDKFISVATRIAFRKQQGLSQTLGVVNKIAECWYRWYETFETKPPSVVLIKVNPKQKKNNNKNKQTNKKKTPYAANWQLILYHNELIKTHKIIVNASAGCKGKYLKNMNKYY